MAIINASWHLRAKIEQVIKLIAGPTVTVGYIISIFVPVVKWCRRIFLIKALE